VIATCARRRAAVDASTAGAVPQHMPAYMVPHGIEGAQGPLPRNPNGKIDRKQLATAWVERHGG
jgi:acyl-CoA synthetase (AMP-forming)/AMP-acid ligase II